MKFWKIPRFIKNLNSNYKKHNSFSTRYRASMYLSLFMNSWKTKYTFAIFLAIGNEKEIPFWCVQQSYYTRTLPYNRMKKSHNYFFHCDYSQNYWKITRLVEITEKNSQNLPNIFNKFYHWNFSVIFTAILQLFYPNNLIAKFTEHFCCTFSYFYHCK